MRFHYSADVQPDRTFGRIIGGLRKQQEYRGYYRRLRAMGVPANVAMKTAKAFGQFKTPPGDDDFRFAVIAAKCLTESERRAIRL